MFRARRRRRRDVGERGSRESDRRRRRRDANQGGRRSSGELGARSMVHRDVVRARARPVPSVRRDTPRRRVGRARSHLGRYQQIVRGGRVCVTRVGEGEVGSGKSVRARRGVRARAPRQTRPRDRDAGGRASRGATRVGRRFRRRFGKNRRRLDSFVRQSSARARRRGARRVPGVQIHRADDVAAIARRLRDAPGVPRSVPRRARSPSRRAAPLAGRVRR